MRLPRSLLALVALVALVALAMHGCVADEPVASERVGVRGAGIVAGTLDLGDPAIVALSLRRAQCPPDPFAPFCTGILVAPRAVLTAAHCARFAASEEIEVLFGADVASGGTFARVVDARVHPAYDASSDTNDLAFLVLAAPASIAPIALSKASLALAGSVGAGAGVRLVGFGDDGKGSRGPKRSGTAQLSALHDADFRYVPAPSNTCSGDSGGPVFLAESTGERLVGVTRSGDVACAAYGDAVRVDAYFDAFLAPTLDAIAAMPPATSPNAMADFCGMSCAADAECAAGMRCLADRNVGARCGYPDVRPGDFGDRCATGADCATGRCAAFGAGESRECRCFTPCPAPSTAPVDPTPASSGCALDETSRRVGRGAGSSLAVALLAASLAVARKFSATARS